MWRGVKVEVLFISDHGVKEGIWVLSQEFSRAAHKVQIRHAVMWSVRNCWFFAVSCQMKSSSVQTLAYAVRLLPSLFGSVSPVCRCWGKAEIIPWAPWVNTWFVCSLKCQGGCRQLSWVTTRECTWQYGDVGSPPPHSRIWVLLISCVVFIRKESWFIVSDSTLNRKFPTSLSSFWISLIKECPEIARFIWKRFKLIMCKQNWKAETNSIPWLIYNAQSQIRFTV